jgi:hypothetical protein
MTPQRGEVTSRTLSSFHQLNDDEGFRPEDPIPHSARMAQHYQHQNHNNPTTATSPPQFPRHDSKPSPILPLDTRDHRRTSPPLLVKCRRTSESRYAVSARALALTPQTPHDPRAPVIEALEPHAVAAASVPAPNRQPNYLVALGHNTAASHLCAAAAEPGARADVASFDARCPATTTTCGSARRRSDVERAGSGLRAAGSTPAHRCRRSGQRGCSSSPPTPRVDTACRHVGS